LLISAEESVAKLFLREILNHIETNDRYSNWAKLIDPEGKGVIPKLGAFANRQEKWSGNAITIDRTDIHLKDPTINAVGLFGSILAKRADIIVCDDIVNQQNSETDGQRRKVVDWLYTTVWPVLVPGGRFVYLGNTWHVDDVVNHLLKDPQIDFKKRLSAIIHEPTNADLWNQWAGIRLNESFELKDRMSLADKFYQDHKPEMDEGVQVLWPERYDYASLYLKRLANSYAFARMYQCDPSDRPDQKFLEKWLDRAKELGKDLKLQDESRQGLSMELTCSGLDLAISEKETADDVVYLALDRVQIGNGIITPGMYVVRNIYRGHMSPNTVKDLVKEKNATIEPLAVRVETVGYQEAMLRDLSDDGVDNVVGYHTGGEKNDPDIGVNSLAILCELGKLVIPYDMTDPRTIQLSSKLIDEMRQYPSGHTGDSLMALWFAFSEIRDQTADKYTIPGILGPQIRESIDVHNPVIRQAEEKKADIAQSLEDELERRTFNEMMRR
jgi:hypothetical protein